MKTPILAGALALALLATCAAGAVAQAAPDASAGSMFRATTLNLSASGEVKAAPDMATISLGVQSQQPTAAEAMADNARQMGQVIAALKKAGIDAKDIQTSGLNLNAQYDYEQNKPPRLTGYQASNQVSVTVYDLARLGQTLDAMVAVGANQINGISFGLKDARAAEDAARLKAVQALQAKAQLYAGATGYRIGRLVSLGEGTGYVSPPQPLPVMAFRAEAKASTPVEAGQLDVRIDVTGLYELTK
ncbi:MAG: SIMPL domain-containing protein [Caulobacteraceae bacterium]